MSRSLPNVAAQLNALTRRRLELEAQAKMVTNETTYQRVVALKREHKRIVSRIAALERRLAK